MKMQPILVASVLVAVIVMGHTWLQIQLVSLIIAPLVFSVWLGYVPEPPEWLILGLAVVAESFSGAPPGIMAAVVLLPFVIRNIFPNLVAGITLRYLALTLAIVTAQIASLVGTSAYATGVVTAPIPGSLFAIVGTGLAAFIVVNVWHEFGVEIQQ